MHECTKHREIISQKNNAPTDKDFRHHVYYFGVVKNSESASFIVGESIGGGHGERGGEVSLSLVELLEWPDDWKQHLIKSGCEWAIEIIESAGKQSTSLQLVNKILRSRKKHV